MLTAIFRDYVVPLFAAIGALVIYAKVHDAIHRRYMEYRGRKLWQRIAEEDKGASDDKQSPGAPRAGGV
jgi:hypothetical protein